MSTLVPITGVVRPAAQNGALILLGALLWGGGVLVLRGAAMMNWPEGVPLLLFYGAIIPGTWPLIPLGARLSGLGRAGTVYATATVCATAVTIDGLVINFAPWIYATDVAVAKAIAGCLLWAIGVALILGFVRQGGR